MNENENTEQENQQEEQQPVEDKGLMSQPHEDTKEVSDDGMSTGKQEEVLDGEDLENLEFTKPDTFPEKFWDEKDGPDVEGLAKAYGELEKKFHNGDFKAPKEYSLDKSKELGFDDGDPVLDTFKDWAKQNNISQTAFDEIVTKIGDMGVEQQEQETIHIQEEKEKLGENADNIVSSNIKWGRGLVSKGVLSEQDYSELEIWGGTASGQRLLNKFRGLMGEREIPTVNVSDGGLAKDEVLSRVADPRYRDDVAFRKQVERDLEELERAGKL